MKSNSRKMNPAALAEIEALYSENVHSKGVNSEAVGWNSRASQLLRFDRLSQVISETDEPISVNDYGCGYGAHLMYLQEQGIKVEKYHGYDLSQGMLEAASKILSGFEGKLAFHKTSEIRTVADYSFVSGTFNVKFNAEDDEWERFIEQKLDEINEFSQKGFSFNLLSSYVDWKESHLFYGDPCKWFDYCKRNHSRYVTLIHDYPLYEWTINVIKV